jgi:hypothetical protein
VALTPTRITCHQALPAFPDSISHIPLLFILHVMPLLSVSHAHMPIHIYFETRPYFSGLFLQIQSDVTDAYYNALLYTE